MQRHKDTMTQRHKMMMIMRLWYISIGHWQYWVDVLHELQEGSVRHTCYNIKNDDDNNDYDDNDDDNNNEDDKDDNNVDDNDNDNRACYP